MADAAFDEFGNFIGGSEDESESESHSDRSSLNQEQDHATAAGAEGEREGSDADEHDAEHVDADAPQPGPSSSIVLHEDKQYYPDPEEVYGPSTEVCAPSSLPLCFFVSLCYIRMCSSSSTSLRYLRCIQTHAFSYSRSLEI